MQMIRTHVLAALARGISGNDDFTARAALDHTDLVVRGAARRMLGRALIDAELAATDAGLARPPVGHVMRLASLAVAGAELPPANDEPAVATAYAALPPARPLRVPVATIAVLAVVLGAAGTLAYSIATHHSPVHAYVHVAKPESATAYKTGGVPLHDPKIDGALATPLTDLVVAAARTKDDGAITFAAPLAALRAIDLGHGKPLADAWHHALDAYAKAITDAQAGETRRDEIDLREAVRGLTEQFAAAGLGYFLEGRFKDGYAVVQAYRVEDVAFEYTNGAPRRVLSISQLDHLNTAYAVLGMDNEDVGDPVIHLERIDEYVASSELPVLAPDAPYPLAEQTWLDTPQGKALAAAAGIAVRREYAAALGADAAAGTQIAKLLVERGDIIDQWRDHLGRKDVVFSRTDDLFVPDELLKALDGHVPNYQLERVRAIDDVLAELDAARVHARIHDLVALTVRRHESQHDFDFDRAAELRYPAQLETFLGPATDGDGEPVPIVDSARHELSAYLSQIINDPLTPHAALWHLAEQVFEEHSGGGELYAGVVTLLGIAKQLGIDTSGRHFDRDTLAPIALRIAALSDDQLRAAAAATWRELFGEPPTVIVDAPPAF
jgi:hypothetical protein